MRRVATVASTQAEEKRRQGVRLVYSIGTGRLYRHSYSDCNVRDLVVGAVVLKTYLLANSNTVEKGKKSRGEFVT